MLQKFTLQIGIKKCLWLKNVKKTVPWMYLIEVFNGEEIVGMFYWKEL